MNSETFVAHPRPRADGQPIIAAIVAVTKTGAIGVGNDLIFKIPEDQRFFRETTRGSPIILGRKNYESIGRPLPNRRNIVMTRQVGTKIPGVDVVHTLDDALAIAREEALPRGEIFILGGEDIYRLAMPITDRIYLTEIDSSQGGDVYFGAWPDLPAGFREMKREERPENDPPYRFLIFDHERILK